MIFKIIITVIFIFVWSFSVQAGSRIYIINDPHHRYARHIGERAFTHHWEEKGGKLIKVDRILTRLKGGKVRVRERRTWWEEKGGKLIKRGEEVIK